MTCPTLCVMYHYSSPTDPCVCAVQLEALKENNKLAKQKARAEKRKKSKEESSEDVQAKKKKKMNKVIVTFIGKDYWNVNRPITDKLQAIPVT